MPHACAGRPPSKSVLVLYTERIKLPGVAATKAGLNDALRLDKSVNAFSEVLDSARFPAPAQREEFADHLQSRYVGRTFDRVVTVGGFALHFALDHRERFFPDAPLVFCVVDRREIEGRPLAPECHGFPDHLRL
jgi:hypothetical protein